MPTRLVCFALAALAFVIASCAAVSVRSGMIDSPAAPGGSASSAAAQTTPPPTAESRPFPRARNLPGFRLCAPPIVVQDTVRIRVEGGRALAKRGYGDRIAGSVVVQDGNGHRCEVPVTLERQTMYEAYPEPPPGFWLGTCIADVSGWPDGAATAAFTATPAGPGSAPALSAAKLCQGRSRLA